MGLYSRPLLAKTNDHSELRPREMKSICFKVTYFFVGTELPTNENFLLHGTKTKISFDAMKLSLLCNLYLTAKSIGSLTISIAEKCFDIWGILKMATVKSV